MDARSDLFHELMNLYEYLNRRIDKEDLRWIHVTLAKILIMAGAYGAYSAMAAVRDQEVERD